MHGRPRKAPKPEEAEASAAKAEKLRALQSQFLSNHQNKNYAKEAVDLSAKLLEINPESYTAWNYRKLAVEHHLSQLQSDSDAIKSVLGEELRVVESALRQNFKSYGAWHHRKWILSKGQSSIENELRLLDKLQKADSRNFHAWNYRRFVADLMNRSEQDELKYTEDMIYSNFSNYSAWHNRSVLLSSLLEKKVEGFSSKEVVLPEEYEFIHQAIFTDPDDQSGWFYHLWLLDQTISAKSPQLVNSWPAHSSDLVLVSGGCFKGSASSPFTVIHTDSGSFPLVLYFNQAVKGVNSSTVKVESALNKNKDLNWEPLSVNKSQAAQVWVARLQFPDSEQRCSVEVSVGITPGIISLRGYQYSNPSRFAFTVQIQHPEVDAAKGSGQSNISWGEENFKMYESGAEESSPHVSFGQLSTKDGHEESTSNWRVEVIANDIECFRELLSSSDCKIGKLTLAKLLIAHNTMVFPPAEKSNHFDEVLQLYGDLIKLDPSHHQYYKDERSLVLLQQIASSRESLLSHRFNYNSLTPLDIGNPICLRLNNMALSRVGAFENFLWVQMLDLSHNELRSIEGLETLQLLSSLNLSNNKISSFSALEPMRQLKSLKALNVSFNEIGKHSIDTTRYLFTSPLSHSAGNEWSKDEILSYGAAKTNYWEAFFIFKGLDLKQLDVVGNAIADEKFKSFLVKILPTLKWLDGEEVN